ncbi:MAG: hypothetical protein OEL91_04350, partial [Burkholderiaceae bacterium]|nr:hypothetical protein [Burkholderiaceae bacterium]
GSLDTSAIGIGAAYHAKLATDWSFTGRLGIARVKTEATAGYRGLTASLSENKVKPYFGLAVGYSMTPGFELQAGWDFSNSADIAGESGAVHLLSVGLSFAF